MKGSETEKMNTSVLFLTGIINFQHKKDLANFN